MATPALMQPSVIGSFHSLPFTATTGELPANAVDVSIALHYPTEAKKGSIWPLFRWHTPEFTSICRME